MKSDITEPLPFTSRWISVPHHNVAQDSAVERSYIKPVAIKHTVPYRTTDRDDFAKLIRLGSSAAASKGFDLSKFSVTRLVRRQWIVIVVVIVVALVGFSIDRLRGIFGSDNEVSRPGSEALENTGYNPKHVLFEVFGSPGSTATINFLDINAQPQRVENAALPWAQALTTDDPTMYADLRAQGDGSTIGCRITVNGIVKDERSTSHVNGYISCLDKTA
jgi:hypothetical protein